MRWDALPFRDSLFTSEPLLMGKTNAHSCRPAWAASVSPVVLEWVEGLAAAGSWWQMRVQLTHYVRLEVTKVGAMFRMWVGELAMQLHAKSIRGTLCNQLAFTWAQRA
jgi:hypothetical protein